MEWIRTIYLAILFILLSPGIIFRFPPKKNHIISTIFHSIIFALFFILYTLCVNFIDKKVIKENEHYQNKNIYNRKNINNKPNVQLSKIINKLKNIEGKMNILDGKVNKIKSSLLST